MKKIVSALLSFVILMSTLGVSLATNANLLNEKLYDTSDFSLSSIELTEQMLIGYNIGNTFESTELRPAYNRPEFNSVEDFIVYKEKVFGNIQVTEEFIINLKNLGVQAVRLPITWFNVLKNPTTGEIYPKSTWYSSLAIRKEAWSTGVIAPEFLARVKQVVDWIIQNDMYVIINTHHDAAVNVSNAVNPIVMDDDHKEQTYDFLTNVWTQVGTYFKDYGSKLIFEFFNEVSNISGSMTPSAASDVFVSDLLAYLIPLIRSQGSNNANRFLVCPRYGGVSFWSSLPFASADTASDKLIIANHCYQSSGSVKGNIQGARNLMNRLGVGAIIDEIGTLSNAHFSPEGVLVNENIRKYSDEYKVSCFYWDADSSTMINKYYLNPVTAEALGAYLGKELTETVYTDISQMVDESQPNWIKLYTPDYTGEWAGKYLIITSEKKIKSLDLSKSSKSMGYYTISGMEDGLVTYYTSDDGINFTRLHTFNPTAWTKIAWDAVKAYGTTQNTLQIDGNYNYYNHLFFSSDFTREGTMNLQEGSDDNNSSTLYTSSVTTGQYVTFTSNTMLDAGNYNLILSARSYSGRANLSVSVNGVEIVSSINTGTQNGSNKQFELGNVSLNEKSNLTVTFTALNNGSFYVNSLSYCKLGEFVPVDPTDVTTITSTTTTTTTSTTTSATTTTTTTTPTSTQNQEIYAAQIVETGIKYEKLETAISSATADQTIKLLKDVTTVQYTYTMYTINRNLTIDLNNFSINSNAQRLFDITAGDRKLVIKNGTIRQIDRGRTNNDRIDFDFFFAVRAGAKLELDSVTIDTNGFRPSYGYAGGLISIIGPSASADNGIDKLVLNNSLFYDSSTDGPALIASDSATVAYFVKVNNCNFEVSNSSKHVFSGFGFTPSDLGAVQIQSAHIKAGTLFPQTANKAIIIPTDSYVSQTQNGEEISGLVNENRTLNLVKWGTFSEVYIIDNSFATLKTLSMSMGAAIRLGSKNGIRFYTNIDPTEVSNLRNNGYTVEFGTLIAPKDLITDQDLTFDLATNKYINVPFTSTNYYIEKDFVGVVGSIVNIKESNTSYSAQSGNIARSFVGRGYVKLTKNNETKIQYAEYFESNIDNNTRSIAQVAHALKNDTSNQEQYLLHKENVDRWAKHYS